MTLSDQRSDIYWRTGELSLEGHFSRECSPVECSLAIYLHLNNAWVLVHHSRASNLKKKNYCYKRNYNTCVLLFLWSDRSKNLSVKFLGTLKIQGCQQLCAWNQAMKTVHVCLLLLGWCQRFCKCPTCKSKFNQSKRAAINRSNGS